MDFKAKSGIVLTDEMAKEYEDGTWSGHGEITIGRPKLCDEDLENPSCALMAPQSQRCPNVPQNARAPVQGIV